MRTVQKQLTTVLIGLIGYLVSVVSSFGWSNKAAVAVDLGPGGEGVGSLAALSDVQYQFLR